MSGWRILFLNPSPLYRLGLADGLTQEGHEILFFDPNSLPRFRHAEAVASIIAQSAPDLALSIGNMAFHTDTEAVYGEIRRRGLFHVYWATEDKPFHARVSLPCARNAQGVFTIDAGCLPAYVKLGIPAALLPFACNPAVHLPSAPEPGLAHDLAMVAHNTPAQGSFRARSLHDLLLPFLDGGYDLAVWGCGWEQPFARGLKLPKHFHYGVLPYEEAARAVASAKIVLGPQWDDSSPTQVSCRTFETLAAGALLVTSDVPGVRHLFADGTHLLVSDGPARSRELVDRFLDDANGRAAIAASGRDLVLERHTYRHRAGQFTETVGRWLAEWNGGAAR